MSGRILSRLTQRRFLVLIVTLSLVTTMINVAAWAGSNDDTKDAPNTAEGTGPVTEGHGGTGLMETAVVYIATGVNFPDALGAAATAALGVGPVLLVQTDAIPAETLAELNRLHPDRIVIVGGTAVVSAGVEASLAGLSFAPTVTRLAGSNRYATAAALSAATFPTSGLYPRAAHAESTDLPDGADTNLVLLETYIVAPAPGVLLIDAGADFYIGPDTGIKCWIEIGYYSIFPFFIWFGNVVPGSYRYAELDNAANSEEDCSTEVGINVAAGSHTVRYYTDANAQVTILDGALTVLWVPFDNDGGIPIPYVFP